MIFLEACAGTAALTWALFGRNTKAPVPMAGSKRTIARKILTSMGLVSDATYDDRVWRGWLSGSDIAWLNDPGEWGHTWAALFNTTDGFNKVADVIGSPEWTIVSDRALFEHLRTTAVPEDPILRAAAHLYLQTRTFRGKPVRPTSGLSGWWTHGFDPEYRAAVTPGAKDRGWFNARPVLADKLRALQVYSNTNTIRVTQKPAQRLMPEDAARTVVYIDPPYEGTIGYGHAFLREDVVQTAVHWAQAGANVFISEAEPLLIEGWHHVQVPTRKAGTQLSKLDQEWLTYNKVP